MYPFVKHTPHGYRIACPKGHTDLIIGRLPHSPLSVPQFFCPYCKNPNGTMQPVCAATRSKLSVFAERDSGGNSELYQEMLDDMCRPFNL